MDTFRISILKYVNNIKEIVEKKKYFFILFLQMYLSLILII